MEKDKNADPGKLVDERRADVTLLSAANRARDNPGMSGGLYAMMLARQIAAELLAGIATLWFCAGTRRKPCREGLSSAN